MALHALTAEAADSFARALTAAPLTKIRVKRFKARDQSLINLTVTYTDERGNELTIGLDSDSGHVTDDGQPENDTNREAARQALIAAMRVALDIYADKLASHPASPAAVFERTVTSLGIIARTPAKHIINKAA
jgi:hypothetical protein